MNTVHAAVIIAGLDRLAPHMASAGRVLGFAGGLFLLWCAAKTLLRRRASLSEPHATQLSPVMAYGTAVTFNAINPMSLMLMLALLSPMTGASNPSSAQAAALLLGVFAAIVAWWVCLVSDRLRMVVAARCGMIQARDVDPREPWPDGRYCTQDQALPV